MPTATQHMTVEEFLHAAPTLGRCELIEGEVRAMSPAGYDHGKYVGRLHHLVSRYVYDHGLGEVCGAETGFVLDAESRTVRAPDLAFIRKDRVVETVKFCPIHPDMCAEVLSPDDRASEVEEKVQAWLDFGTPLVWVVDPRTQTVTARQPRGKAQIYRRDESLPGGDSLPGFLLPLEKLFG